MNVTGYKSEYFQNHILKAAVECAMCNGTGKITEKQFGGKSVAEQSRVEPGAGAGAGGDIWKVSGDTGASDRSHGRMNNCATLDSLDSIILLCDDSMLIFNMSYQIVTLEPELIMAIIIQTFLQQSP